MDRSRSFLCGFAVTVIGLAGLLAGALIMSAGRIDPLAANGVGWTATIVRERIELVDDAARAPSIVIVAGSSGRYGLSASIIEQATGMPTINASTHAALPWGAIDRLLLSRIRDGDTVLLPLEYEYLGDIGAMPLPGISAEIVHSIGIEYFLSLGLARKIEYLRTLPLSFLVNQLTLTAERRNERPTFGYWAHQSRSNGDLIAVGLKPAPEAVLATSRISRLPASIPASSVVCASIRALRARGIRVVGTPPSRFIRADEQGTLAALLPALRSFYEQCGADYVSDANGAGFDIPAMLDTLYHLTDDGRRVRSGRLVAALCERMPCRTRP